MKPRAPRSRPMLAADPVALAIAEGRQRQHRVPMRPQPAIPASGGFWYPATPKDPFNWRSAPRRARHYGGLRHWLKGSVVDHAPWRVGDSLYVREAWALLHFSVDSESGRVDDIRAWTKRAPKKRPKRYWEPAYRAGGTWDRNVEDRGFAWRPNILCPEWAARTRVELTRVWAEQVQDISEEDAWAEVEMARPIAGELPTFRDYSRHAPSDPAEWFSKARDSFRSLWESLYPGSCERNDWVWCCSWNGVGVRS